MAKTYEESLEFQDLFYLHRHFGDNSDPYPQEEVFQAKSAPPGEDIWSEAVRAVSAGDEEKMRQIQTWIRHADLAPEEKEWWEAILNIALKAPLDVLRKSGRRNLEMPPGLSAECVSVAAGLLTARAAQEEQKRRRQIEKEEEERLRRLREEAAKQAQKKRTAEHNLEEHMRPRENRR